MDKTLRALTDGYTAQNLNLRASSALQIRYTVTALERWAGFALTVRQCAATDLLCRFLRHRLATTSKSTAKRDRGNIVTLLRFAKSQRLIAEVPDVPTIRQEKKNPAAWTVEEVGQLLTAASNLIGTMRDLPITRSWWYTSFLLFLYTSGARVTSALTLRVEDVWISRRTALLRASTDKTWTDQIVSLSDELAELLSGGMGDRELVFPYPWNVKKIWLDLAEIRELAGLPFGREFAFHRMRRTHATQAVIVAGWEAARKSLGHSNEAMTRSYVDASQVRAVNRIVLPAPKFKTG